MRPTEFILELAGIVNMLGSTPPTDEQWGKIREMHQEAVGWIVKEKLLERAETLAMAEQINAEESRRRMEQKQYEAAMQFERMKMDIMQRNVGLKPPSVMYGSNTLGEVR